MFSNFSRALQISRNEKVLKSKDIYRSSKGTMYTYAVLGYYNHGTVSTNSSLRANLLTHFYTGQDH